MDEDSAGFSEASSYVDGEESFAPRVTQQFSDEFGNTMTTEQ